MKIRKEQKTSRKNGENVGTDDSQKRNHVKPKHMKRFSAFSEIGEM